MIAFVGADRGHAQRAVLEAQQAAMETELDNAAFTREVGHPAARAVQAFGAGDYAQAPSCCAPSAALRIASAAATRSAI